MNSQDPDEHIEPTEEPKARMEDTSHGSIGCGLLLLVIGLPWFSFWYDPGYIDAVRPPTSTIIRYWLGIATPAALGLIMFVRGLVRQGQWRNLHPINSVSPSESYDEGLILGLGIAGLVFILMLVASAALRRWLSSY